MLRTNLSKKFQKTTISEGANSTKNPQNATKTQEKRENSKKLDYSNNPINVAKTPVLTTKQSIDNKDNSLIYHTQNENVKFFYSLENFQRFAYGHAKHTDNFLQVWQSLGYEHNPAKSYSTHKLHPQDREKKLSIYGNGFAYKNDAGNIIDFLTNYRNHSFDGAYEYIAKTYGLEYEIRPWHARTTKPSVNTTKTNKVAKKLYNPSNTDLKKETQAYFESRIYSELGLSESEAKNYFFPSLQRPYGIGIRYTDLDKNTLTYGDDNKTFSRVRLTKPYQDKNGNTAKYLSPKGAGTFPYITALAHAQTDITTGRTLYITEGEIKALYSVNTLKLPFIGVGGVSLVARTEKDIFDNPIYETACFDSHTKEVLKRFSYDKIHLLFDSDTFQNKGKEHRYRQFFAAIKKAFIAAQKLEIKTFTFSVVNPNNSHHAKGIDDFDGKCEPLEVRTKLLQTSHHNGLFWHFKLDTKEKPQKALKSLEDAFKASFEAKPQPTEITINGKFLGGSLLENTAFKKSILTQQYTYLDAPTGLGKSYFVQHFLTPFLNSQGYTVLFAAPRNAIAKQQALEKGKIVFTADTETKAIERLKNEAKDIIYTNFDKLRNAYQVLTQFHGLKVFIVIDEAHLVPFDSSFRADVIGSVLDTLKENTNNLLMTATPTELSFATNNFKVIATQKKPYNRPNLVFCSDSKMTTYALEKGLQVIDNGSKVIVHLNNIDSAKTLKKAFESEGIKTHLFASNGLDTEEKEAFEAMQAKTTFYWSDNTDVIITTSVLEAGINIETDKAVTNIYLNKTPFGFDNTSYRQFIARIRNYDTFEVDNIIVTQNYKHFLPCEDLVVRYNYQNSLELAFENAIHHTNQMEKLIKQGSYEKDRFSSSISQNVYLNEDKGYFDINYQHVFTDYTQHTNKKGSPFFENPTKVFFYENEIDKGIKSHTQALDDEKEKAENEIVEMFYNDFDCLLKSVNKETKDVRLESQTTIQNDKVEAITLTAVQLQIAEKLLIDYFQLLKTSPYKVKDVPKLKSILTCKKSFTMRQTQDLGKRKRNYINYWLLDRKEKGKKTGVEEYFKIEEFHRIIAILEKTKGKELTAQQLTDRINKGKHKKNIYTKKTALSLSQMLCEITKTSKRIDNKKTKIYQFESVRIWEKELEKLTE